MVNGNECRRLIKLAWQSFRKDLGGMIGMDIEERRVLEYVQHLEKEVEKLQHENDLLRRNMRNGIQGLYFRN